MLRNNRHTAAGLALGVALGFLAVPTAMAQDGNIEVSRRGGKGAGEVSLDVVERPLKDVINYIQEKTDVNLVISAEAEEVLVTIKLKNLPWREALNVVTEKAGCQVDERSANLIQIEKPPQVSFEFTNADVREVIKAIADISGANIVVGREVEGTVSVTLHDIPWRVALDTVVKTLGYTVVEEERGILRIVSPASIEEQLETRVFRLKYVRPAAPYRPIIDTQISSSSVSARGDSMSDIEAEFNLLKAFRSAVGTNGAVQYIKETNALIATGTTPRLSKLEKLIARMDIEPAQVFVDVKFISTSNTDFLDIGVTPGDAGLSASLSLGKMVSRLPFSIGDGGFETALSPFRDSNGKRAGPEPLTNSAGAFTFGTLDFSKTNLALNLIKTDSQTRIVQAPKLIALDNQEATIFVGETIRFARTVATSNQSGGLEFSIDEAANSPVQVGFQLLMIPHVIPESDQIMMTIIPQERSLTGRSAEQPGFDVFQTGAGGTTGEQTIALPREQSSTVITNMKLDNRETAVIGGLLRDQESHEVSKVPYLGDIPVLGYLFRGERTSSTRSNLIIFVTPQIIRDSSQMRSLVVEEMRDRQDRIESELLDIFGNASGGSSPSSMDAPAALPSARPALSGPK